MALGAGLLGGNLTELLLVLYSEKDMMFFLVKLFFVVVFAHIVADFTKG